MFKFIVVKHIVKQGGVVGFPKFCIIDSRHKIAHTSRIEYGEMWRSGAWKTSLRIPANNPFIPILEIRKPIQFILCHGRQLKPGVPNLLVFGKERVVPDGDGDMIQQLLNFLIGHNVIAAVIDYDETMMRFGHQMGHNGNGGASQCLRYKYVDHKIIHRLSPFECQLFAVRHSYNNGIGMF